MRARLRLWAVVSVCSALTTGCLSPDLSDSSGSISDVVSSPFESLSSSSGGESSAYLGDVEALVLAYLETPAASEHFARDLARVAGDHGITDWEGDARTAPALGAGLRRGGLDRGGVERFIERYLARFPGLAPQVRRGWEAAPAA